MEFTVEEGCQKEEFLYSGFMSLNLSEGGDMVGRSRS